MASLSQPFDAVIFDMDGTLLDTEAAFRTVAFEVVAALGFAMTDALHRSMVGSSHETTRALLETTFGSGFCYQTFDSECRRHMQIRLEEAVPLKLGAREMLEALKANSIPIAVATSSREPHAISHLGAAGIVDLFDTIVTRDDVINPKPHPEPYLMAAQRLGADPRRCIAFEDSHAGVRAAHAAGMRTIMIPDLVPPTPEITALCAMVLETLGHAHGHIFPALASERSPA